MCRGCISILTYLSTNWRDGSSRSSVASAGRRDELLAVLPMLAHVGREAMWRMDRLWIHGYGARRPALRMLG